MKSRNLGLAGGVMTVYGSIDIAPGHVGVSSRNTLLFCLVWTELGVLGGIVCL